MCRERTGDYELWCWFDLDSGSGPKQDPAFKDIQKQFSIGNFSPCCKPTVYFKDRIWIKKIPDLQQCQYPVSTGTEVPVHIKMQYGTVPELTSIRYSFTSIFFFTWQFTRVLQSGFITKMSYTYVRH